MGCLRPWWALAVGALLTTGCGSGLITGIVAGSDSSRPPSPSLTLFSAVLPLMPSPGTTTTIGIDNVDLGPNSTVRVVLQRNDGGAEAPQPDLVVATQGSSRSITFTLDTAPIRAGIADLSAADLPASLLVFVDNRPEPVAPAVPVVLARQPRAKLLDGETPEFLSPRGGPVSLRVEGLRASQAAQLQVLVHVPDPNVPSVAGVRPRISRLATGIELGADGDGVPVVTATVPGNPFPVQAELEVRDAIAGVSTTVRNAFYRPEIDIVSPSQGPTTGTSEPRLIGIGLVPRDFTVAGAAPLRFDDVHLSFAKGGRLLDLSPEDLLVAESTGDQLRFRMPSSPDGRPGRVDILLRVELDRVAADGTRSRVGVTVTASRIFLFANPNPFFGPRGTVLERAPVAVAPILLDSAQGTPPPPGNEAAVDFIALTEVGGVAHLQLLLAQGNGMFQRFAAARQIGSHEQPAERGPRDVCIGDFDDDGVPDVFVVNEGAAAAVHQVVLGQVRPLPPLGAAHAVAAAGGSTRGRVADFDGDGRTDVLLVPGPNASPSQRPQVLLSRPIGPGQPSFAAPIDVPVRSFEYEAVEVADLDGDSFRDVAVVNGSSGQLDVAYGLGNGAFGPAVPLDFLAPALQSRAIGLHACRDVPRQSLAVALAGGVQSPPPAVAVLRQDTIRQFSPPAPGGVLSEQLSNITATLVDDFDDDSGGKLDMLVAFRDGSEFEVLLLQLQLDQSQQAVRFELTAGTVIEGSESARQIRSMWFGRAFPRSPDSAGAQAVFVVHEADVDGSIERRLSTRLIPPESALQILPPDGGGWIAPGFEDLVAGNFLDVGPGYSGPVRNLALLQPAIAGQSGRIRLIENDGFGGFPGLGDTLDYPGLLPGTAVRLPAGAAARDRLLFGGRDSRFGIWDPAGVAAPTLQVSTPLRLASADPLLQNRDLEVGTKVVVGDVDGDGIDDAVVLLAFGLVGEGQAALALLRGKAVVGAGEFPFHAPLQLTPVHGRASALVLGDFAADGGGQPVRLELAVAVPDGAVAGGGDGNHVRFFRYQAGAVAAEDRLVPGAAGGGPQVLLAGNGPTALGAADFDRDGSIDLLVACGEDRELRLFRNVGGPDAGGGVVVSSFVLASGSPPELAPGLPRRLQLGDINGDGSVDAVVGVEFTSPTTGQRSSTVAVYLSSGTGDFVGPRFLSPGRLGQRGDRMVFDLGDWNSDQVVDLLVGWNTVDPPITDNNLRVLFGGTR